jgi:hypothetical protein
MNLPWHFSSECQPKLRCHAPTNRQALPPALFAIVTATMVFSQSPFVMEAKAQGDAVRCITTQNLPDRASTEVLPKGVCPFKAGSLAGLPYGELVKRL